MPSSKTAPLLLLTQGHAGDRLGARLLPALRRRFPEREILGVGGLRMRDAGARLVSRSDGISAMGYTGVLPEVPRIFSSLLRTAAATRRSAPACLIAVDVWQPLRFLHRFAPHLRSVPHVCYLPPGPNFIGTSRVHGAAARVFDSIVTPFPHQAELFRGAGARVRLAGHAGLQTGLEEAEPLPPDRRENLLALLPGSRALEIRYSLPVQYAAARQVLERFPELTPVVCCANEAVERAVAHLYPELRRSRNARQTLARAGFGIICSGTAVLEAAVFGCPGVVTYSGSPLQRWEYRRFHVEALARLRAAGIASPYFSLPNIISGEEIYPELIDTPAGPVAEAALGMLGAGPEAQAGRAEALRRVRDTLSWEDAGTVVADEVLRLLLPTPAGRDAS